MSETAADVQFRRARADELHACAALYERVLKETFTWIPIERHRASDFIEAARYETVFVAVAADRILGLLSFYEPAAFVHSLYVDERGRGIGKALLDYVHRLAGRPISLKVQAANRRALAFYQREGFQAVEEGFDAENQVMWLLMAREEPPAGTP